MSGSLSPSSRRTGNGNANDGKSSQHSSALGRFYERKRNQRKRTDSLRLPLSVITHNRRGHRSPEESQECGRYEHKYNDDDKSDDSGSDSDYQRKRYLRVDSLSIPIGSRQACEIPLVTPRDPVTDQSSNSLVKKHKVMEKAKCAPKKKRRRDSGEEFHVPLTARELGSTSARSSLVSSYVPAERKSQNVLFTPR